MSLPKSMNAVFIENSSAVLKSNVPLPALTGNSALVKVRAAGVNPIDYKNIDYKIGDEGAILGCDYAGEIVALSDNADPSFSIGDTVVGFLRGATSVSPDNGAFAEYVAADLPTVMKLPLAPASSDQLPPGKVDTFEGAVTLPCVLYTVALAIAFCLDSKFVWQPAAPQHDHPILVWGGATASGQCAIQLLKNLNAYTKIIVVASKQHESLLKQYGADEVFDYHDQGVEDKIKAKYPNIYHALDVASFPETLRSVNSLVPTDKPVKIIQLLYNENAIPENEQKQNVSVDFPLSFHVSGHDEKFGPYDLPYRPGLRETVISFVDFIVPRIKDGSFVHLPTKILKGIESIPEGVDLVRKGANRGFKVTVTL